MIVTMTSEDLKRWRELNGYTQEGLAKVLGTYQATIGRWETNGRRIPSFLHLALRCLELEGGESTEGKRKRKGSTSHGKRV